MNLCRPIQGRKSEPLRTIPPNLMVDQFKREKTSRCAIGRILLWGVELNPYRVDPMKVDVLIVDIIQNCSCKNWSRGSWSHKNWSHVHTLSKIVYKDFDACTCSRYQALFPLPQESLGTRLPQVHVDIVWAQIWLWTPFPFMQALNFYLLPYSLLYQVNRGMLVFKEGGWGKMDAGGRVVRTMTN